MSEPSWLMYVTKSGYRAIMQINQIARMKQSETKLMIKIIGGEEEEISFLNKAQAHKALCKIEDAMNRPGQIVQIRFLQFKGDEQHGEIRQSNTDQTG